MEQEKINKVVELSHDKYMAIRNYERTIRLQEDIENLGLKKKEYVVTFLENADSISGEEEDFLYTQISDVIKNAWAEICAKQLSIVKEIEKELAEL